MQSVGVSTRAAVMKEEARIAALATQANSRQVRKLMTTNEGREVNTEEGAGPV